MGKVQVRPSRLNLDHHLFLKTQSCCNREALRYTQPVAFTGGVDKLPQRPRDCGSLAIYRKHWLISDYIPFLLIYTDQIVTAVDWMCVSAPHFMPKTVCENLICSMVVFRGGAFRKWWGSWGLCPYKRPGNLPCTFCPGKTQQKVNGTRKQVLIRQLPHQNLPAPWSWTA